MDIEGSSILVLGDDASLKDPWFFDLVVRLIVDAPLLGSIDFGLECFSHRSVINSSANVSLRRGILVVGEMYSHPSFISPPWGGDFLGIYLKRGYN